MRRLLLIPVLVGALALGAGCTDAAEPGLPTAQRSGAPASPAASASAAGRNPVAFARCMREHGVSMPDPQPGEQLVMPDIKTGNGKSAFAACRDLAPAFQQQAGPTAQELEKLRAFAACMREHKVPMDDPVPNEPNGGKMRIAAAFGADSKEELFNNPTFKAAMAACKSILPADMQPGADKGGKK
jgi:hypothetical protein